MRKLKEFRFKWSDAWGFIDDGIDTVLETKYDDTYKIRMYANGKPHSVKIDADKFIDDLESMSIIEWNQGDYSEYTEDGCSWSLSIKYDETEVYARGSNGYPKNFYEFISMLHKHGFPHIRMEKWNIIRTATKNKNRFDFVSTYWDYVYWKKYQ